MWSRTQRSAATQSSSGAGNRTSGASRYETETKMAGVATMAGAISPIHSL